MQHDYDVYVFTTDRDLGATAPYENIVTDTWVTYDDQVKVYYASPAQLGYATIKCILQQIQPRHIYLNSMYSRFFTIYPLLLSKRNGWKSNVVLAPRGMLKQSAIQFKQGKKKIYLQAFKWLDLHKHITFQATDETEYDDIKKYFGQTAQVVLAPNNHGYVPSYQPGFPKIKGTLKIIFIGRIHPIKNLDFLLQALKDVTGSVSLTVVGSAEDKAYTERCQHIAASLPAHISVQFAGEIPNNQLPVIIKEHHIFGLPTRGENFGHAIFEALAAAKPVLISDQTPWRQLEQAKAGWDLALDRPDLFTKALQQAVDFDQVQYDAWTKGAWDYINATVTQTQLKETYQKLFN